MDFYSGICQRSRSISPIFFGENVCDNCIIYLIDQKCTQLCMSGKSIIHIMSLYGLSKFQVYNYDSWITIKIKIINVSESNVKDESRKAAGNVIDLLTVRENCDNVEFSYDELNDMLKYVCTE